MLKLERGARGQFVTLFKIHVHLITFGHIDLRSGACFSKVPKLYRPFSEDLSSQTSPSVCFLLP